MSASTFFIRLTLQRRSFGLDVDLQLPLQGVSVLFGPSGSGKTTLLRCVAGLEKATGVVSLGNEVWQDSDKALFTPTWQREIGYVFQEASLFEHLDVRQNLMFGLARARVAMRTLDEVIDLLGISPLLDRSIEGLSGGERQRVAIARALSTGPRLLLLDEPLAALDVARRKEVLPWLERINRQLQIPLLYVTHSVDELARLADHVVMFNAGRVTSQGPVSQVMVSQDVAVAIGEEAGLVARGEIIGRDAQDHLAQIRFAGGVLWVRDQGLEIGQPVRIRILARDVSLSLSVNEDCSILNYLEGRVESIDSDVHPSGVIVRVRCGQQRGSEGGSESGSDLIVSRITRRSLDRLRIQVGSRVWCQVKSVALIV